MRSSLQHSARLVRIGMAAELRNPGMRLLGVVGAVGAAFYAWSAGSVAASAGVLLATWLGRAYGIAACLWFAYAAIRDQNEQGGALRSKPVDGAQWVWVNWATGMGVWLVLLGVAFLAAALAQFPAAGLPSLPSHALGFARAAVVLAVVSGWSYSLSRMLRSPLGGVLTMFAWFCAMAGLQFIPAFLRPDYTPNGWLFLGSAALLLCLAALGVERYRRGELRRPLVPVAATLGMALLTAGGAAQAYRAAPPFGGSTGALMDRIAVQHLELGRAAPGFWLPDGRGGTLRVSAYSGRILLIYLFAADDPEAARTLPALEEIYREYGRRGVQPLGVCLSPDPADGWMLARAGGYSFPIGSDPGTVKTSPPPDSPVAIAYDTQLLPLLVVTDRRRRAVLIRNEPYYSVEQLRRIAEQGLNGEPE